MTTPVPPALTFLATPPGLLLYFLGSNYLAPSVQLNPFPSAQNEPPTFPRHATLIPRPLAPLPKPAPGLLDQTRSTDATILRSVILLPGTKPADHAVGVLVRMVRFGVVAFVAGEDLGAAAEAEPAV